MTTVRAFQGLRYSEKKFKNITRLVAPPYDVITKQQALRLKMQDSHNVVRLILPKIIYPHEHNPYAEAARTLETWIKQRILVRDEKPCLYVYHQIFMVEEGGRKRRVLRKGFMALRRLEPWGKTIFPHERTLSKPKKDRTLLTKACRANLSPIFALYSDPQKKVEDLFKKMDAKPLWQFKGNDAVYNRFWRVDDPGVIEAVTQFMSQKKLYIADGHHRYETALGLSQAGGAQDVLMFFSNLHDPGLCVLPTHRLLKGNLNSSWEEIQKSAGSVFKITSFPASATGKAAFLKRFYASKKHAFGFVCQEHYALFETTVAQVRKKIQGFESSRARLGSSLLHDLFFDKLLKDKAPLEERFNFEKEEAQVFLKVAKGGSKAGFLLQAPHVQDIITVCEGGETLPQKTTYFYPKLLSGLVINKFE